MLHISNLAYTHSGARQAPLHVPAFALAAGEHGLILGPSGCGKSTLLHLLAGILRPQQGTLQVAGTDLGTLSPRRSDAWRARHIGFIPQKLALIASLTARENVLLAAYASGQEQDVARADRLLDALGLRARMGARPRQLSQGEQQRVALARALYNQPALLLADEPTANLDDGACAASVALLRQHAIEAGASLVIATHDVRVRDALPEARSLILGKEGGVA